MRRRLSTPVALVATLCLLLTGCGTLSGGVYDAPLPGGADLGDNPKTLTVEFKDALDLVPQSSVKVDNVAVGRVSEIELADDGRTAVVTVQVRDDIELPAGTTARLQQTSLLGEKYVALVRPEQGTGSGSALKDGATLATDKTDAAATVEQVLGALSLVLNGGGITQFQEISRELQKVGGGRTEGIRTFLEETQRFVEVLDDRRTAITGAIDGLAELSETLDDDREKIATALEGLSPGMKVLAQQRPQLTKMLKALDRLSKVTIRTLNASQKDIVRDFELLAPILQQLATSGSDLPHSLEVLLTYPFPDSVLGAIRGDYLNVFLTTNFRTLPSGCAAIGCWWPQPSDGGSAAPRGTPSRPDDPPPTLLPPTDSATPGLPSPTVPGPSITPSDPGSTDPSAPGSSDPTSPGSSDSTSPPTESPTSPGSSDPTSPGSSDSGSPGEAAPTPATPRRRTVRAEGGD